MSKQFDYEIDFSSFDCCNYEFPFQQTYSEISFDADCEFENIDVNLETNINTEFENASTNLEAKNRVLAQDDLHLESIFNELFSSSPVFDDLHSCDTDADMLQKVFPCNITGCFSGPFLENDDDKNHTVKSLSQKTGLCLPNCQLQNKVTSLLQENIKNKRYNSVFHQLEESISADDTPKTENKSDSEEDIDIITIDDDTTGANQFDCTQLERNKYSHMTLRKLNRISMSELEHEIQSSETEPPKQGRKAKVTKSKSRIYSCKQTNSHSKKAESYLQHQRTVNAPISANNLRVLRNTSSRKNKKVLKSVKAKHVGLKYKIIKNKKLKDLLFPAKYTEVSICAKENKNDDLPIPSTINNYRYIKSDFKQQEKTSNRVCSEDDKRIEHYKKMATEVPVSSKCVPKFSIINNHIDFNSNVSQKKIAITVTSPIMLEHDYSCVKWILLKNPKPCKNIKGSTSSSNVQDIRTEQSRKTEVSQMREKKNQGIKTEFFGENKGNRVNVNTKNVTDALPNTNGAKKKFNVTKQIKEYFDSAVIVAESHSVKLQNSGEFPSVICTENIHCEPAVSNKMHSCAQDLRLFTCSSNNNSKITTDKQIKQTASMDKEKLHFGCKTEFQRNATESKEQLYPHSFILQNLVTSTQLNNEENAKIPETFATKTKQTEPIAINHFKSNRLKSVLKPLACLSNIDSEITSDIKQMDDTIGEKLNKKSIVTITSNEEYTHEPISRNKRDAFRKYGTKNNSIVYSGSSNRERHLSKSQWRESCWLSSASPLLSDRHYSTPQFNKCDNIAAGSSRLPTTSTSFHTFQYSDSCSSKLQYNDNSDSQSEAYKKDCLHYSKEQSEHQKSYKTYTRSHSPCESSASHKYCRRNLRSSYFREDSAKQTLYLDHHHNDMETERVVYVGNLPDNMTEIELERLLRKYGCIKNIKLIHRNTNYGFVTFNFANDAAEVVKNAKCDPDLDHFRINFGGQHIHRQWNYVDLDKSQEENEIEYNKEQKLSKQRNECF